MRAGRLDRRVTIQEKAETPSASGEPVEAWSILEQRRAASQAPVRGDEKFRTPETVSTQQVEFRIRWSENVAELQPNLHRLVYPALTDAEVGQPIAENRIFDILTVDEIGRREGLKIIAERHPDVVTS